MNCAAPTETAKQITKLVARYRHLFTIAKLHSDCPQVVIKCSLGMLKAYDALAKLKRQYPLEPTWHDVRF